MKLLWTRLALTDVKQLYAYIAEDNATAARQMVTRIQQGVETLKKHPYMGKPGRVNDTRELMIGKSPYCVVYQLQQSCILILAVIHQAQRWPD